MEKFVDIGQLAKMHVGNAPGGVGLKALSSSYLKLGVNKTNQDSDWKQQPLPSDLLEYAALDTSLSL
jgi:ribonuclease D